MLFQIQYKAKNLLTVASFFKNVKQQQQLSIKFSEHEQANPAQNVSQCNYRFGSGGGGPLGGLLGKAGGGPGGGPEGGPGGGPEGGLLGNGGGGARFGAGGSFVGVPGVVLPPLSVDVCLGGKIGF